MRWTMSGTHQAPFSAIVGRSVEPPRRDHDAAQAALGGRVDLGDRVVGPCGDRHDRHAEAAGRVGGAEVGEPAIVRPGPRLHGRRIDPHARAQPGTERRAGQPPGAQHVGVGEQHLGSDALLVEDGVAHLGVVAGPHLVVAGLLVPLGDEVGVDHAAGLDLGLVLVERLPEVRVEVLAVHLGRWSGVAVRRDDEVGAHRSPRKDFLNEIR
jgi:hypothetical protein